MTMLIEQLAGIAPDSPFGRAVKARAEVLCLSEAAHDAVLVPRDGGGLSHGLRAALAARMCRHLGNDALVRHYLSYLAHSAELDVAAFAEPDGVSGDERHDAMARHADLLTRSPRNATRNGHRGAAGGWRQRGGYRAPRRTRRLRELPASRDRRSQTSK
jgi:uncharacterized protein YciW